MRRSLFTVALLTLLAAATSAQALSVGDVPPPVTITDWVKGKPMDVFKDNKGKVIVLEFWATWCPPCIQLIPDNTEFYQKYKDKGLVFVSITDMGRGQTLKTVQEFVGRQGDKMNYPVAFDSTQRTTLAYEAYGLPHGVVIGKDGRIVWMGHPGDPQMKQIVVDLLEDRYDSDAAIKKAALSNQLEKLTNDVYMAMQQGKVEEALAATDRMLDLDPANFDAMQFRVAIFVDELQDMERMRAWAEKFIESRAGNAEALVKIAHLMLAIPNMDERQPDLAVKAAQAAYAADSKSPDILQAIAMVYYQIGDLPAALRYQQQAVDHAEGDASTEAKSALKFFQTCQSLRENKPQPADG